MIHSYKGISPKIDKSVKLMHGVQIIGDVVIGKNSSVWFNCVVRGDVNYIRIGEYTNIQDGSILHVNHIDYFLQVGSYVTAGHNCILHGCVIGDNVLIGMGAIVMDNCEIGSNSIIAAGAVLTEGTIVPGGCIYAGVPAKKIKDISEELINGEINRIANNYLMYSGWFK